VRYDELLKDFDLSVATAARMSATFPYVSPAARPSERGTNGITWWTAVITTITSDRFVPMAR
jgi:hypothetical protein